MGLKLHSQCAFLFMINYMPNREKNAGIYSHALTQACKIECMGSAMLQPA